MHCRNRLDTAARKNCLACLKEILKDGSDIDEVYEFGWINHGDPLHIAAKMGHTECLKALLEANAFVDPTEWYGNTPLHFAAKAGHIKCLELLLEAGANVNAKDMLDETPLQKTQHGYYLECVTALLKAGSEVHPLDIKKSNIPERNIANELRKEYLKKQNFMLLMIGHKQKDCILSMIPKELLVLITNLSI